MPFTRVSFLSVSFFNIPQTRMAVMLLRERQLRGRAVRRAVGPLHAGARANYVARPARRASGATSVQHSLLPCRGEHCPLIPTEFVRIGMIMDWGQYEKIYKPILLHQSY